MILTAILAGCLINEAVYSQRLAELTDHDGDSFVQEDDCDDTSAAIFPGAEEWCNEVDDNCDGVVDGGAVDATVWYADSDGDGFGLGAVGTECAAPAGTVANSADCDDASAAVGPEVAEVPYDGIDNDCAGGDLVDVDGDGWPSVAAFGADCDDTDPEIFPEAEESWLNGVTDNDCDGEIEEVQLAFGGSVWAGFREGESLGRLMFGLGDLDADGRMEVGVGSTMDSTAGSNSGAIYLLSGEPGGSIADAVGLFPDSVGQAFGAAADGGVDVTEDGVADLLVCAYGTAETEGMAWLVDGARWSAAGSTTVEEVSIGWVRSGVSGTYGPGAGRFVGDVDGDGLTDVALGECCSSNGAYGSVGRVAIVSAGSFDGTLDDADAIVDGPWEGAYFGHKVDVMRDVDGDGLADVLVSGEGGIPGALIPGNRSGNALDVAHVVLYGDVTGTFARNVGDLDGDGGDDVAIVGLENRLLFITALRSVPSRDVLDPGFTFTWGDIGGVLDVAGVGDLDEDGRDDVIIPLAWSNLGDQRLWVLPGESVQYGKTVDASEVPVTGLSVVPGALFGYGVATPGDVDGDGEGDLALGAPDHGGAAGAATLVSLPH